MNPITEKMPAVIDVTADRELQILRVRMAGDFGIPDVEEMVRQTTAAVRELDDPLHVRVLSDGRGMGKADAAARRMMMENLKRPNMERYAMWGTPAARAMFMKVLFRISGIDIIRFFKTEAEGLAWLAEGR